MTPDDPRGQSLRAFDIVTADFTRDCAGRFESGGRLAGLDIQRLTALAERLAGDLTAWARAVEDLDVGGHAAIARRPAGRLLVESVFDAALAPAATRVLAAALTLALAGA